MTKKVYVLFSYKLKGNANSMLEFNVNLVAVTIESTHASSMSQRT